MTQPTELQLTHLQPDWDNIQIPFEGDVLDREKLAVKMTAYLSRLKAGAVLAIDAPWGEGKSWFGRNWAAYLKAEEQNYRVVYIDAFEQDYIEDPFLLIATELAQLIKDEQTAFDSFSQVSYDVIKAITTFGLPLIPYLMATVDPTWLLAAVPSAAMKIKELVSNDEVKALAEKVQEQGTETANEWFKHKFEAHEKEKESVKAFRTQLKEIAKAEEKPIVIFIDELDRCRPDFSVKIIERIKHFFNVENVVFVLLLNREQLQNAVKGVYGEKTDAATYLGKFVNFFFTLPKGESDSAYNSYIYRYMHEETKKYHQIQIDLNSFSDLASL
jgi:predicted KAP-like P-loop ATPase